MWNIEKNALMSIDDHMKKSILFLVDHFVSFIFLVNEGFSAIATAGAGPPFASEGPALAITREKIRARHTAEGWRFW